MNAPVDVAGLVAATKSPELIEIEQQLAQATASLARVRQDWAAANEQADPQFQPAGGPKSFAAMAEASTRRDECARTAAALERTSTELRHRAAEIRRTSSASLLAALNPIRDQALNEMKQASERLYRAIELFNAATIAAEDGGGPRAPRLPTRIELLDHWLSLAAKGI